MAAHTSPVVGAAMDGLGIPRIVREKLGMGNASRGSAGAPRGSARGAVKRYGVGTAGGGEAG
jgi:hypothetical protein